jgi:hypothetical protein
MRALPVIERILIAGAIAILLAVGTFLLCWHLRWNAQEHAYATLAPRPGLSIAPAATIIDPTLRADYAAWKASASTNAAFAPDAWGDRIDDWAAYELDDADRDEIAALCAGCARDLRTLDNLLARGLRLGVESPCNASDPCDNAGGELFVRAARVWQLIARLDRDPATAFDHQTALLAAVTPRDASAFGVCDGIAGIRADTCLEAAWAGLLDDHLRARWEATENDDRPRLVAALDGERWRHPPRDAARRFASNPLSDWRHYHPDLGWRDSGAAITDWWAQGDCMDRRNVLFYTDEDAILAHTPGPWPLPWHHYFSSDGANQAENDMDLLSCGWSGIYQRHLELAAADILAIADRQHALPADAHRLDAAAASTGIHPVGLLAGTPDLPGLTYERPQPHVITLVVAFPASGEPWPVDDTGTFISEPMEGRLLTMTTRLAINCAERPAPLTRE